jgi:hypothetical protein
MVNATTSDGNSSDTTDQGGEMVRNYKGWRLYSKDEQTGDQKESGLYEIQDHTCRSTTNYEYKYPQVGKTGVDAVNEKLPTDGLYHEKRIVICNMCNWLEYRP